MQAILQHCRLRYDTYQVRCFASEQRYDIPARAIGTVVGRHPNRLLLLVTFYWIRADEEIWAERAIVDPAELESIL